MAAWFHAFSTWCADILGQPIAFLLACASVLIWAICGPVFGFSDTWQLVINTATTVLTFLMLFVLQHTVIRDSRAVQTKLDELIKVIPDANNELRGIEREDCEEKQ